MILPSKRNQWIFYFDSFMIRKGIGFFSLANLAVINLMLTRFYGDEGENVEIKLGLYTCLNFIS